MASSIPLTIPSGEESGLKLTNPGGFEIRDNLTTTVILDFDAAESVHLARGSGYVLRPVIRLLDAVVVEIDSPTAGALIASQPFVVEGTYEARLAGDEVTSIVVNGTSATLGSGSFSASVTTSLTSANATITAIATTAQGAFAVVDVIVRVLIVDADRSAASVAPTPILADGVNQGVVTIELATSDGIPVAGLAPNEIHVDAEGADVVQPVAPTDASGRTTAAISSSSSGLKRVTVQVSNGTAPAATLVTFASFVTARAGCGDGVVAVGEACDDGNVVSGDGCRADCLGSAVPQANYGGYVTLVVEVAENGRYVVQCVACDRILEASAYAIPDLFRVTTRGETPRAVLKRVLGPTQVELEGDALPAGAYAAIAFDALVEQGGHVQPGTAQYFYSVENTGAVNEHAWGAFVCASGAARCARSATGEILRIVLPTR